MNFAKWLETFLSEKNISSDMTLEVEGPSGMNYIPVGCLIEAMNAASKHEQKRIKRMIIKIDFLNGDVLDYFRHLCRAIAV